MVLHLKSCSILVNYNINIHLLDFYLFNDKKKTVFITVTVGTSLLKSAAKKLWFLWFVKTVTQFQEPVLGCGCHVDPHQRCRVCVLKPQYVLKIRVHLM